MPDLSHFWQRFVQASALIFGLALGVAATVFAYSNTAPVTVGWSVFRLGQVPLWSVALVPIVLVLIAATIYHWWNSFHHFTEHMRHRHRVRELETEVKALKGQLDGLLGMPDHEHSKDRPPAEPVEPLVAVAEVPALPAAAASNGGEKTPKRQRKQVTVAASSEPEPVVVATAEPGPATEPQKAANSEG